MRNIIALLQEIPFDKFRYFLHAQHVRDKNTIIDSLLFKAALKRDLDPKEVIGFADPIHEVLEQFNKRFTKVWVLVQKGREAPKNFSEEDRLDVMVALVRSILPHDKVRLAALIKKIEILADYYRHYQLGYQENALISLSSALTYYEAHPGAQVYEDENHERLITTVTDALLNGDKDEKQAPRSFVKMHAILDVYASLPNKIEFPHLDTMHKLNGALVQSIHQLELFIDTHVFHLVLHGMGHLNLTMNQSLDQYCGIMHAVQLRTNLQALQAALHDKGKRTPQRLGLFCQIYREQDAKDAKAMTVGLDSKTATTMKDFKNNTDMMVAGIEYQQQTWKQWLGSWVVVPKAVKAVVPVDAKAVGKLM